jgi:exosome complex component RRP45
MRACVSSAELSQMAAPSFESGRGSELAVEIGRVVERGLRESRAIETEGLCIVAGEKVRRLPLLHH